MESNKMPGFLKLIVGFENNFGQELRNYYKWLLALNLPS